MIKNVELKIISILQGSTNRDRRMSINELTARVYGWEENISDVRHFKELDDDEINKMLVMGMKAKNGKSNCIYDRIRIVGKGIYNIIDNMGTDFGIKIYAPFVECTHKVKSMKEHDRKIIKTIKKEVFHIDTQVNENSTYCEKMIFMNSSKKEAWVKDEIKSFKKKTKLDVKEYVKEYIDEIIENNGIIIDEYKSIDKTAFPDIRQWQLYYQQPYSDVEAFIILSGLRNQIDIETDVIKSIANKLIRSTSDVYFKQVIENISLEVEKRTMADDYLEKNKKSIINRDNTSWHVLSNIRQIMKAISMNKKIIFERIYYTCDYKKKLWLINNVNQIKDCNEKEQHKAIYSCTPINIFIEEGRYWVLALKDNYNTPDGNFMPCPLDLITDITILEEDGCPLNEIKFIDNYDANIKEKRISQYMKTNYEKPEEFFIKIKKNITSGNLILRTFGNDYTFDKSTDEYDVIKVIRSPFGIINWALMNTRDVELIPTEKKNKRKT